MYKPRLTTPILDRRDPSGLKLYSISASGSDVTFENYSVRLEQVKSAKGLDWSKTAAFAILHEGATLRYLVLAWWGNDNELFNSVSVEENCIWIEDTDRYSFCLWDLEVIWHERNSYIKHMYSGNVDLEAYRQDVYQQASD